MAIRYRFKDIKERIKTEFPLIIDGGANNGSTTAFFLKQYKNPTIHAFEPIPELAKAINDTYLSNERVIVHNKALGSENKRVLFNVVNNIVSSSILTPTDINRVYHGSKIDISRTIEVDQVRLDEVLSKDIDILKIDLQGYELEALKGCERLFSRIKAITTEIEFVSLYEEQPLFSDIDIFLRGKGFKLLNLYELYTHPDGQLTSGDAVYLNAQFY
jgi:FkbM family methyltransferase